MKLPEKITLVLRPAKGGTLEHILPSVRLGARVYIGRDLATAVIASASEGDLASPALKCEEFSIDEHVKLVADARRYRWLRGRERIEDPDEDLLVVRGDSWLSGDELDHEIDTALRLEVLQQQVVPEQQP
ncbi:carbon storage regulator [Pseudomonas qingdaonensis]|uniref:carbon storage regulator n=1 Tax=Pseudomonas qingdaonensis TaxID=2056231 RepID=UPI0028A87DF2|nr:carbon storage regulator [Pseudomonas qingdaonensis]